MIRRIALGLVVLALAFPLPGAAQSGDLRGQIAKMSQAWQTAYNKGDAAALAALYTEDATVMAPGAEPASGHAAIQSLFAADIAKGAKNTLTLADANGSGDYAVETGKWEAKSTGGKHLDHGSYMTFYKKTAGGWKIYRDIWNSSMGK
ncbi:MAG TPA: SgcJ/EcaC family oxidoreductase [Gemmatimonadales bacterium]|jgi:uncharacterized protein (TIGR02246 family)|nr:SgcJ/EcaC family oxidoreductase [Gemmatimonadales bacterium]